MSEKPRRTRVTPLRLLVIGAGLVVIAILLAPRIQAMLRPQSPATVAMIEAATQLDLSATAEEPPVPPANPETDRERLIAAARKRLGIPYKWAAKGPDLYDCSGFTRAAYSDIGVKLPNGSFNQAESEQPFTSLDQLAPGDLLFYRWPGAKGVKHVTLYLGDGWVIGTGSPRQPPEVTIYPLASDFAAAPGTVVTFRHVELPDES